MSEVRVEYDYSAENDDELSMKVGDVITDVKPLSDGWCTGLLNGRRGAFPDNFVKVIRDKPNAAPKPAVGVPELRVWIKSLSVKELPSSKDDSRSRQKAKVLYQYTAQNADELSLAVDDIVEIHREVEDGWFEGSLNGKTGMLPSNFVALSTEENEAKVENVPEVHSRKIVGGVGFGNIFSNAPIQLRKVDISKVQRQDSVAESANPFCNVASGAAKLKPVSVAAHHSSLPKKPTAQAQVLFDYQAKSDDELSLSRGEIVTVLDKNPGEFGWWKGQLNGRTGVFPNNFVSLLSSSAEGHNDAVAPGVVLRNKPAVPVPSGKAPPGGSLPSHYAKKEIAKLPERRPVAPVVMVKPVACLEPQRSLDAEDHKANGSNFMSAKQPGSTLPREKNIQPTDHPLCSVSSASAVDSDPICSLRSDVAKLRLELEQARRHYESQINDLVSELDESKKLRVHLQIDVDRLKKQLG